MLNKKKLIFKRVFDLFLAIILLPFLLFPVILLIVCASMDTKDWGLFKQPRVGQKGAVFNILKIRTLRGSNHNLGFLDNSASKFGRFLRQSKLDELPQIFNVLKGDMSFVGPRPDIEGFADKLLGDDRKILIVKPGITGPATLKYKNEEAILNVQKDAELYNRTIIWVDKVEINKKYVENWSFCLDLKLLIQSIVS